MPSTNESIKQTSRDLLKASNKRENLPKAINRPIIMSVPHSGTRFLQAAGLAHDTFHTMSPWEEVMRRIYGATKIYVPLRNPYDIWVSWCRRKRLDTPAQIQGWYRSWYQLHALDMMYDLDVVCVDQQKDERITSWKVVGHDPGYDKFELVDVNLASLWELPIVWRHYEKDKRVR